MKFGWCIDGKHEVCRVSFQTEKPDFVRTCSCECHQKPTTE